MITAMLLAAAVVPRLVRRFNAPPRAFGTVTAPSGVRRARTFVCPALRQGRWTACAKLAIPALAQTLLKRATRWFNLSVGA